MKEANIDDSYDSMDYLQQDTRITVTREMFQYENRKGYWSQEGKLGYAESQYAEYRSGWYRAHRRAA